MRVTAQNAGEANSQEGALPEEQFCQVKLHFLTQLIEAEEDTSVSLHYARALTALEDQVQARKS